MEEFNVLSDEEKLNLFVGVYNLMARYNRMCGWVVYLNHKFLFFDSKPSYEDSFFVVIDELKNWILELGGSFVND